MEVGCRRAWIWWQRRTVRLWWVAMGPLMLVFGIVTLWPSKGSNMAVVENYNPAWSNSSTMNITSTTLSAAAGGVKSTSSSNLVEDPLSLSPPKNLQRPLGLTADAVPAAAGDAHADNNNPIFVNSSVSILSPGVAAKPEPEMQKEEIQNVTLNFPLNESHAPPPLNPRIRREFSSLELLEAKLQKARLTIRGAANANQDQYDPEYVPTGPMYWNGKAFHRSYLEMEKQFKIYMYEEGEPPIFHNGPCGSIYSIEGNFISHMENSKFRTRDIDKAHVYFIPITMAYIVHFVFDRHGKTDWHPMKKTVQDYVSVVAARYPFWNRSLGADHFVLSCHDWGPELSKSVPEMFKNSIRALCNANTSEGFNPSKDVSIPEINLPGKTIDGLIGGPSPSKRPILAFFAGGLHGPVRPVLLEHWENKDEDISVQKYLPKGVSYYGMLKKSKFCLCPSGYEVASPRIVEAFYSGCVPVIIKDHYALPFSDVLKWKTFSVEIPVNEIPNLKKILSGISSRQYIRMQKRGKQIRRHFELRWPPHRYDVVHMILHSIWLRRLNIRLRGTEDL